MVTAFGAGSNLASNENREAAHHFTFGADLVLFLALCLYIALGTVKHRQALPPMSKWGPLILVIVGSLLALVDVLRHLLLDHGGVFFKEETLAMYSDFPKLSWAGRIGQLSTIFGIASMFLGTLWYLQITDRFKEIMRQSQV